MSAKPKVQKLTARQSAFVAEYLLDLNATQAAIRAGYSPASARRFASLLLQQENIQQALHVAQTKRSIRTNIDADYVLQTIRSTVERCAQAEPVLDADGNETGEYKFDASNVLKGCELLGKHMAMWTDKVKHEGSVEFLNGASDDELDRTIAELAAKAGLAIGNAGKNTTH